MLKPAALADPATLIRPALAADLDAVERIEREQFSNPWSRDYFAAELGNRFAHIHVAAAVPAGEIVGYLLFWRLDGELELHKIAVCRAGQRQGTGRRLLRHFLEVGRSWGCARAVLEVRESNVAAIHLYETHAFRRVGRRKNYYCRPSEDALVYEFDFRGGVPGS
jgi:ribosomal-protein-alanine N-acetyltransferase